MIIRGTVLTLFLVSALSANATVFAQEGIRWAPDIPTAKRAAAQFNVPLLIHFYGDNCLPCKLLEDRVFSRKEFVDTVNKYFICVRVNATQDRQTAAQYQVHSWPTDVFVSPDGKTLYQGVCQQDVSGYLGTLQNVAIMNRDRNVMLAAQQSNAPQQNAAGQLFSNSNQFPNGYAARQPAQAVAQQNGFGQLSNSATDVNIPLQGASPQLPQNTAMASNVQRGPLQPSQQPLASNTAVPGGQQVLQGPAMHGSNLPQNTGVSHTAGRDPRIAQYPSMPNPSMPNAGQLQVPSQTQPQVSTVSASKPAPNSRSMDNPYYQSGQSTFGQSGQTTNALGNAGVAPSTAEASASTDRGPSQSNASAKQFRRQPTVASGNISLDGYCPVALKRGEWINGNSEYSVRHRGKIYWLSSQPAMEQFLEDPDGASPILSGYDPLIFLEEGRLVSGDIHFGLHEQVSGSYLLFSSKDAKKKFWESFDKYTNQLNSVLKEKSGK